MPRLAWNAIVKNEAARIERCVRSLLPYIDCGIVVDTGSTDETVSTVIRLFDQVQKPFEIHQVEFVNFEQSRNAALELARKSPLAWDYLLLADADMELRVERGDWLNGHTGLSYDLRQVGGSLSYYNRRLVSRAAGGGYVGVTHEYLDIPSAGRLDGAHFIDHADGANRPDKFSRDIALLEAALKTETRPGLIERYHFYLAQSYFDAGRCQDAIPHYRRRVELGGFEEERWYAQFRLSLCFHRLGDYANFVWEALRAYSMRPRRVEMLHELAQFFRVRGDNYVSLLFSELGLRLPYPKDELLFVDAGAYGRGIKEEFSICAYYDPKRRLEGAKVTNKLALAGSEQAKFNQFWYLEPLAAHVPSFRPRRIEFTPPEGWLAMNPSVVRHAGNPALLVRCVNYTITPSGEYWMRAEDGTVSRHNPVRTRNVFAFEGGRWMEIALPEYEPQYQLVRGFEDSRVFEWRGELLTLSTVRDLNSGGWCEQVLARLDFGHEKIAYSDSYTKILPRHRQHEKNWMPWI